MDYRKLTWEFRTEQARVADLNAVRDLDQALERLHNQLEELATVEDVDKDELRAARMVVARGGLTIRQLIPRLDEIRKRAETYAGPVAIRTVCADIIRTELDGTPIDSIKSGFELPPEYRETVMDKVKSVLTR